MKSESVGLLILEDSLDDLELIRLELEKGPINLEISHATGKTSFEQLVEKEMPQIVLSDYNIPDYDIIQALNYLKHYGFDGIFILITGALGDEQAVDLIVNYGVDDYILKDNLSRLNPAIKRKLDKKKLQADLAQKNNELKELSLVASHTHNGVIITDSDGLIKWVNEAYTQITGYTLEESKGKKPGGLLQGEETDQKTVVRIAKQLDTEQPFTEEILNYNKAGVPYWIKLDIAPVLDENGEVIKYIAIQEDITKRKEAEQALIANNKRLKEAQRVGKIGDWSFDVETKQVTWSDELFEIYNRDRNLGTPTFEEIREMTDREDDNNTRPIIEKAIKEGGSYDVQVKISVPKVKYIRAKGKATLNNEGKIIRLAGTVQDITDLKETEIALREKTDQLNDMIDNIGSVILKYVMYPDKTQKILYISKGVEKLYGVSKKEALDDPNYIFERIHQDDIDAVQKSILKSALKLTPWDHTWRYINDSGGYKYIRARGIPHKNEDGSVVWNTIAVDETERIEKEQRKNELENLLTGSLNEIYIFDAESLKLLYCNNSALHNIQYSDAETKELTPLDLKIHLTVDEFYEILEKVNSLGETSFETIHRRKDGSEYNVIVDLRLDNYRGKDVYVANILDTTELVKMREELSQVQKFSELAVEGAEVGLWEVDLKTFKTFYNEMYYKMLGYETKDVTFTKDFHDSIIHPEDNEVIEAHMSKILAGEIDGFEETIRLKAKSGKFIWILDKAKVVEYDQNNKPSKLAGTHLDITDLEKALQEKNVLIQEVHHRVKNNLAIISGLIELQMMRQEGAPAKGLMDTRNRIHTIATVHEQLYKTDSFSEIKVASYFESLIKKTETALRKPEQEIEINFKNTVDQLNINQAVPLGLLVNELITNSMKHAFPSNKGSIDIEINAYQDDRIKFMYQDSGKGFDFIKLDSNDGFGLELINTLISQFTNEFEFERKGMFKLEFDFKVKQKGAHSNI